jgi:hypothetical protein
MTHSRSWPRTRRPFLPANRKSKFRLALCRQMPSQQRSQFGFLRPTMQQIISPCSFLVSVTFVTLSWLRGSTMVREGIERVEPCVVFQEQQALHVLRSDLRQTAKRHESSLHDL